MSFLVTSLPEGEQFVNYLCEKVQDIANEAISSRGKFLIGVSGGSVINYLSEGLPKISTDWSRWRIFLCDERLVKEDDPESTYGSYKKMLLDKIPGVQFLVADISKEGASAATQYEEGLKSYWTDVAESSASYGMADCLILGLGPDGHTCSLFPGHPALEVSDRWTTYIPDSPKPPPERITLTFPFINKAASIFVVGVGQAKWDILKKVQSGEDLPIGRVSNPGGHLEWILNAIS